MYEHVQMHSHHSEMQVNMIMNVDRQCKSDPSQKSDWSNEARDVNTLNSRVCVDDEELRPAKH